MARSRKRTLDLDMPGDALIELERLAAVCREADEAANLARAERDALIARTLTMKIATGVEVSAVTGITQPRCVQIRKQFAAANNGSTSNGE